MLTVYFQDLDAAGHDIAGVLVVEAHLEAEPVLVGGDQALAARVCNLLDAGGVPRRLLPECTSVEGQAHGIRDVCEALRHLPTTSAKAGQASPLPFAFVSIADAENAAANIRLGLSLAPLRRQGIAILGSGLASFHNFNYFFSRVESVRAKGRQHSRVFDSWLRSTLAADTDLGTGTEAARGSQAGEDTEPSVQRLESLQRWAETPSGRHAHPEGGASHLMPLLVLAGAAEGKPAVTVYHDSHTKILGSPPTYQMSHFLWH